MIDEEPLLGRSAWACAALALSGRAGDAGPPGLSDALRPKFLITPGIWLSGLRVFPKFLTESNGVEAESVIGDGCETPGEDSPLSDPAAMDDFLELPWVLALSALRSRGVLRPLTSPMNVSSAFEPTCRRGGRSVARGPLAVLSSSVKLLLSPEAGYATKRRASARVLGNIGMLSSFPDWNSLRRPKTKLKLVSNDAPMFFIP